MTKAAVDFVALLKSLRDAVETFDTPQVDSLCGTITSIADQAPDLFVHEALKALRRKLYFGQMQRLAEFYLRSGTNTSDIVRRQYAQALIEQGFCWPALSFVQMTLRDQVVGPGEYKELAGLTGRAWKQLFVEALASAPELRQEYLQRAIEAYHNIYRADAARSAWHGINTVALLDRAKREGIAIKGFAVGDVRRISQEILTSIPAKGDRKVWDEATAMEVLIALGRKREAAAHALVYVMSEGADAFELRSTLRQLEEIWQLTDQVEPGKSILSLLRGHLASLKGGAVTLSPEEIRSAKKDAEALRNAFGEETATYEFYKAGLERARSVARITGPDGTFGTGFLVNMRDFGEQFSDQVVLMTCGHVLKPEAAGRAKVRFEAANLDAVIKGKILWRDRYKGDLGLWWVEPVKRKAKLPAPCPLGSLNAAAPVGSRIVIIGHPDGRELTYSMANNEVIYADSQEIQYRAPTRPGSSGSPVFDGQWQVVGMHQRGGVAATPAEQVEAAAASSSANAATTVGGAKEIIAELGSDQHGKGKAAQA